MEKMNNKIVYTPGPSEVRENVRLKRAEKTTNPDVDVDFCEFYKNTCDKMAKILKTQNDVYILSGEGNYNDNGIIRPVKAGDITFTPSGSGHGLDNTTDEDLVFMALIIFD